MYKRILVPLDESQCAEAVLPHVEALALRYAATVILLQVVDFDPGLATSSPYDLLPDLNMDAFERRISDGSAYLEDWQRTFRTRGIACEIRLGFGAVVEAIMEAAEDSDADLVAMASHGRSGLARVFYGSVAAGVMQRIDRPLLLVRAG